MSTVAECPPPRCDPRALNAAAVLAWRLYPGPVGEVLADRLTAGASLGFLGPDGLTARLVEALGDEAACRGAQSASGAGGSGTAYPPDRGSSLHGDARGLYGDAGEAR